MKSLIIAATLLTISPTASAAVPEAPPIPERYEVMDKAAVLARAVFKQCKTNGVVVISYMVNGKREQYLMDCHVTDLGVRENRRD